jgi:microcystin-dependent protein
MEYIIGQIVLFSFKLDDGGRRGLLPCEGQKLPVAQNPQLFNLIGSTFGGDGTTTFCLPDYRSSTPKGSYYYIATQGMYP